MSLDDDNFGYYVLPTPPDPPAEEVVSSPILLDLDDGPVEQDRPERADLAAIDTTIEQMDQEWGQALPEVQEEPVHVVHSVQVEPELPSRVVEVYRQDERATIYHGDCLAVLRTLPDASIDAVVTDPPYGLSATDSEHVVQALTAWVGGDRAFVPNVGGGGFMGKAWDKFVPPPAVWDECYRVLKPGGHLLTFGGTRTFDLVTIGVRLAGFEIRDSVAWLYGCHDAQTEALTRRGWVNGLDLTDDDEVAQWSIDGMISLVRPSARQRYSFEGQMVRFRNDDIDQLVTPNHRVYRQVSERTQVAGARRSTWSGWRVDEAASINRWQRTRLPAAGLHDGPGIGGVDYAALLGWVWSEGGFDLGGSGVRVYQSSTNQPFVDEIAALLDRLGPHKRYDYQRTWKGREYTSTTWYISGDLAHRIRADLPGKSPTYDLLWQMTSDEKRALWSAAMKGDGSKAQRAFWQKSLADLEWAQALLAGIGCRGKIAGDPRGVMHWTDRPTVELQARHLADKGEDYTGEVWCVTVPSGAFIVRRNGKVSVSGNSGFPKSLDVSKAIDKASGAERTASDAVYTHPDGKPRVWAEHDADAQGYHDWKGSARQITAPATPDAARWQGWGTALKPAFEPVVVGRKPLVGTVAANVLAWGTGALNIDATRIITTDDLNGGAYAEEGHREESASLHGGSGMNVPGKTTGLDFVQPQGRFPANVVLSHTEDCVLVGTAEIKTDGHHPKARGKGGVSTTGHSGQDDLIERGGEETVEKWRCVPGCPVAELDRQSGDRSSPWVGNGKGNARGRKGGKQFGGGGQRTEEKMEYGDIGGASRFFYVAKASSRERPSYEKEGVEAPMTGKVAHPTVKPLAIMDWLVRLVTPPDGVVLDPFLGSGTTAESAVRQGFRFIGIEREAEYLPLTDIRLDRIKDTP